MMKKNKKKVVERRMKKIKKFFINWYMFGGLMLYIVIFGLNTIFALFNPEVLKVPFDTWLWICLFDFIPCVFLGAGMLYALNESGLL